MIQSTGIVRKVDELGRVVLPVETRKRFGIEEKDGLEILMDTDGGQIILQKTSAACVRCGSAEDLKQLNGCTYLCAKCIAALQ